jgi:hypothetical protein
LNKTGNSRVGTYPRAVVSIECLDDEDYRDFDYGEDLSLERRGGERGSHSVYSQSGSRGKGRSDRDRSSRNNSNSSIKR